MLPKTGGDIKSQYVQQVLVTFDAQDGEGVFQANQANQDTPQYIIQEGGDAFLDTFRPGSS